MATWEPVLVNGQPLEAGVVLIDKPVGITSFAVVRKLRRLLGIKKIGHAGTLDPFASGLLILCVGRGATRHIDQFMQGQKKYEAVLQLGVETDTLDLEGRVVATGPVGRMNDEAVCACLQGFVGPGMQAPPAFSAAKHRGRPLYHYARRGVMIRKDPRPIEIYNLEYLGYDADSRQLSLRVECSRGTYVRVLASDIGRKLGCGAHLCALRRTGSGCFSVHEALDGGVLDSERGLPPLLDAIMPVSEALSRHGIDNEANCLPARPSGPDTMGQM
jgi:tRNA pseudouridine55 synthase